ncbi:MAG TPA: DUF4142 domain-containing protein [Flavisolibacter sp.]|jgi:putative membrane protein|nr:DUF4142 domain-containing protein [Flavisolibacter sp.]
MKMKVLSAFCLSAVIFTACNNDSNNTGSGDTTTTIDNAMTNDTGGTANISNNSSLNNSSLDTMDQNFAMKAASGSMAEIEMANLAMQHGQHPRVKAYATMMIRDHGQASEQLKGIASGRNVSLPGQPMPDHMKHMDMVRGKTGAEFDRIYMQHMVSAHQMDVSDFQRASNNLKDTALKGFATRTLPVLRMHLDSAKAISKIKL